MPEPSIMRFLRYALYAIFLNKSQIKISYLPEKYSTDHELVKIDYHTINADNVITVIGRYEFKKSVYKATDYNNLKFFLSEIVKKFNDKVILEKVI